MDADAVRKKRQEELDEKRRRLEEMRKARGAPKSEPTTPPPQSSAAAEPVAVVAEHIQAPHTAPSSQPAAAVASIAPRREIVLSTCKTNATNILPVSVVSYDKGCQTDDLTELETDNRDTPSPSFAPENLAPVLTPVHFAEATTPIERPKKTVVVDEVTLTKFLGSASLWVERALEQSAAFDILKDFSRTDEGTQGLESKVFDPLLSYDDDHIKDRPVMDIHWSPHMSELFLVSYGAKIATRATAASANKDDSTTGLLYVWSKDLHSRPEFKFVTSSAVLCAAFHTVEQHLIIGGCYNGQIVIWDMRIPKENPVQRSSISGRGHKHPICAVSTSAVSNELLTVSSDGMLCQWDSSRLSEPLAVFSLSLPTLSHHSSLPSLGIAGGGYLEDHSASVSSLSSALHNTTLGGGGASVGSGTLNLSALSFGRTDTTHFAMVGCGDGQLVRFNLNDRTVTLQQHNAHYGLVTAVVPHPNRSQKKYSSLLLTSSLDWTVKLWSMDTLEQPLLELTGSGYDYITDVQWSPVYPTVFSTISSGGTLAIWNLAKSTAAPIDTLTIAVKQYDEPLMNASSVDLKAAQSAPAATLNKSLWASDGASILVGDSSGTIHRIKVNTALLVSNTGDDGHFEMILSKH